MKQEKAGRADRSAATVKKQLESPQPSIEGDGHLIEANQWFKVGLSWVEVAALKKVHAQFWKHPKKVRLGKTMRLTLLCALAHCETLKPYLEEDAREFRAAGGFSLDLFLDTLIAGKFNLPAGKELARASAKGGVR